MTTKASGSIYNKSSSSSKRTSSSSRDRDKKKLIASESGSSHCETPPLTEKDTSSSSSCSGKFAGISPESIGCMAEQVNVEITSDALTNLAEDVSFKIRQVIHNIALSAQHSNKAQVQVSDVNSVLKLMDSGPILGPSNPHWVSFSEENLCCEQDIILDLTQLALTPQQYETCTKPSLSINWILEEKSIANGGQLSAALQKYYKKLSRAIVNGSKKARQCSLHDLATNGRIGPVIPYSFNLAVLILNDDNLNTLNITHKIPLQTRILDMIQALCLNPCSPDTNILEQLQRLFPVMVSNILGNSILKNKLLTVLAMIIRTWPPFRSVGASILNEYLCENVHERLSRSMLQCLTILGRDTLIKSLEPHLDFIENCLHTEEGMFMHPALRDGMLDASTLIMQPEPITYLEDYILTDYTLYEMLGDSIEPRRLHKELTDVKSEVKPNPRLRSEDVLIPLYKTNVSKIRLKILQNLPPRKRNIFYPFTPPPISFNKTIRMNIRNSRSIPVRPNKILNESNYFSTPIYASSAVILSCGALNRFIYKLPKARTELAFVDYLF